MLQAIEQGNIEVPIAMVNGGYQIDDPIMEPGISILMHVATHCDED